MDRHNAYRDRGDLKETRTSKSKGINHHQHADSSERLRKSKTDSNQKEKLVPPVKPPRESLRRKYRTFAEGGDYGYNRDNKLDIDRWKRQINDLETESESDQYQSDAKDSQKTNVTNVPPPEFIQVKPKMYLEGELKVTQVEQIFDNGGSGDSIKHNEGNQMKSHFAWQMNSKPLTLKSNDDAKDAQMKHATASQYDIISKSGPIIAKSQDSLMNAEKLDEIDNWNEEGKGKATRSRGSSKVGPRKSGENTDENLGSEEDEEKEDPDNLFEVFKVEEPKLGLVTIDEESYRKFYEVSIDEKGRKKNKLLHEAILNNLPEFVKHPVYPGFKLKCIVTRNRGGIGGKVYPSFELKLETGLGGKIPLLAARKRKKAKTSYYLITTDYVDLHRRSDSCVGKVRSNLIGTQFTIYDSGVSPKKYGFEGSLAKGIWDFREELGVVAYEKNVLGLRGPRKMKIIIPAMINKCQRYPHFPESDSDEGLQSQSEPYSIELKNKNPVWNSQSNSYVLNFFGRVTEASVKNFQIVKDDASSDSIYMQFGRTDTNTFSLDIGFPFCPLQAFGIALSSLDYKIGCE